MDAYDYLEQCLDQLSPFPARLREQLRNRFIVETMSRGSRFLRAGETERRMGFVVSGLFRFFYLDADAKERFVAEDCELNSRLRLKDIASYLGMTDVTLSRLRSERT